jgi:hypothetical protein
MDWEKVKNEIKVKTIQKESQPITRTKKIIRIKD